MLCIQLLFLLATIGSYVSVDPPTTAPVPKPEEKCTEKNVYHTKPYGNPITPNGYDCRRYWLCMKMADGSYAWVEEKCMGNLHYDGTACSAQTTTTKCVTITTTTTVAPTTAIYPKDTCNKDTVYTTEPETLADKTDDPNHFWLCMKTSSGGYEWILEKCMGALVYQDGKCEVSTTKKLSVTPAYNP